MIFPSRNQSWEQGCGQAFLGDSLRSPRPCDLLACQFVSSIKWDNVILYGHSHDSRNLTFLFRSREATTHRVYLNEVDTPLRTILGATLFRSFLCAQSCDLSRPRILGRFVGLVLV